MEFKEFVVMLNEYFNSEVSDVAFEEATWGDKGDGKNNLSPRDNLLAIFKRRLRILEDNSAIKPMVESFVADLEKLQFDAPLYSWVCFASSKRFVGWASENKVIYAIASSGK